MKANVVFILRGDPRAVLRVNDNDYFVVMSKYYADMAHADDISGDLPMRDVKWLFNVTRGTLIDVKVLGRYATMQSAIQAMAPAVASTPGR
jgi:hypothetical protein